MTEGMWYTTSTCPRRAYIGVRFTKGITEGPQAKEVRAHGNRVLTRIEPRTASDAY